MIDPDRLHLMDRLLSDVETSKKEVVKLKQFIDENLVTEKRLVLMLDHLSEKIRFLQNIVFGAIGIILTEVLIAVVWIVIKR